MRYNPADFKPGDVAMVTTWDGTHRAELSKNRNWNWPGGLAAESAVLDARRLAVLDPESAADVQRFQAARDLPGARHIEHRIRAALHSLTRPPKPDEPKGLAAVVVDRDGDAWTRDRGGVSGWRKVGVLGVFRDWSALDVPPDGVKFGGVS